MSTSTTPLIVLCGAIGAGKDTVGAHLVKQHGFQTVSIAAPLKELAIHLFGLERRHAFGTQADKSEPLDHVRGPDGAQRTPRQIIEHLGTEGVRAIDPDTWLKLSLRTITAALFDGTPVGVTDARFPNEFEAYQTLGAEVWLVEKTGGVEEFTGHASDTAWREYLAAHAPDRVLRAAPGDLATLHTAATQYLGLRHDARPHT